MTANIPKYHWVVAFAWGYNYNQTSLDFPNFHCSAALGPQRLFDKILDILASILEMVFLISSSSDMQSRVVKGHKKMYPLNVSNI